MVGVRCFFIMLIVMTSLAVLTESAGHKGAVCVSNSDCDDGLSCVHTCDRICHRGVCRQGLPICLNLCFREDTPWRNLA